MYDYVGSEAVTWEKIEEDLKKNGVDVNDPFLLRSVILAMTAANENLKVENQRLKFLVEQLKEGYLNV